MNEVYYFLYNIIHFILDIFTRFNPTVLLEFKNGILLIGIFFLALHIKFDRKKLGLLKKDFQENIFNKIYTNTTKQHIFNYLDKNRIESEILNTYDPGRRIYLGLTFSY